MSKAFGTVRHGEVKLDHPVDWTDGTRVEVHTANGATAGTETERQAPERRGGVGVRPEFAEALQALGAGGLPDSFWPLSEEETQLILARMDAVPSLMMTDAEYEHLQDILRASKAEQKKLMVKNWSEIESLFP